MDTTQMDPALSTDVLAVTAAPQHTQRPASRRLLTFYTLASFGSWAALITPIAVTMALRVQQIDPAGKATSLGLVLGAGAFFPVVTGPVIGLLSERTTSRLGMRRPWIIGGAIGGFLGLLLVATATTIPIVLLGCCLTQMMFSVAGSATQAIIPDQFPEEQRAKLAGLAGMAQQFGTTVGIAIAELVNGNLFLAFMIPAVLGLLTMLGLASVLPDRHLKKGAQAPLELMGFFKSFWLNPCRYPDFGWAFVGRFLMSLGLATYGNYTVYRLIDHLHYTPLHIPGLLLIGATLISIVITAAAILDGTLSDPLRRRKVFVIVAALFYTVGNVIVAFSHSFAVYLIGGGLAGTAIRSTWRYLGKQTNTQAAISPEVL